MRTVLVFGGGGWVGQALLAELRSRGVRVRAPASTDVDVTRRDEVRREVDRAGAAGVVNLAGVNPGEGDEARMMAVNATGARNVAFATAKAGARLVHVSTDQVLDGLAPPYFDDAAARPLNAYGRSKAQGEAAVLEAHTGAVAVRTSLVFDPAVADPATCGFIERLGRGEACGLYTDEIRSPIARGTLASALVELLGLDVRGTLNVAGTEPLSRYDYHVLLLRHFRVRGRSRVRRARAAMAEELRALDLTLDVSYAASLLATPLRGVRDELARHPRAVASGG